jgi:hypothetical protein
MSNVLKAIAVTAELTGTELSKASLQVMESDLLHYPENAVLAALVKCRRELKGKLTISAVIERIDAGDGRPTGNEAWSIALMGFDESRTVVTNQEINEAMGFARPIMKTGDSTAARMAFRDAYERIVAANREKNITPGWFPSLGTDTGLRDEVIKDAISSGRLEGSKYAGMLTCQAVNDGKGVMGLLEDKSDMSGLSPKAIASIAKMKEIMRAKK